MRTIQKTFQLIGMLGITLMITACGGSGPGETQPATPQATVAAPDPTPPTCELVMGWDPWEPYQYEISGGHVFGLDVDLVTAVVRNAGCDIAFSKGSWRELLEQLENGDIHLVAGATRTPYRERFAWFSDPYRDEQFYLYVTRDRVAELAEKGFEQLVEDGFRIGVVDEYLYGDPVSSFQENPEYNDAFTYSSMSEANFSRLLEREVDAIIEDKFVGASIIRHKNLQDSIMPHPLSFDSTAVSIMVSREAVDEELFNRLNESVQELLASGAIDKVLAQYQNP